MLQHLEDIWSSASQLLDIVNGEGTAAAAMPIPSDVVPIGMDELQRLLDASRPCFPNVKTTEEKDGTQNTDIVDSSKPRYGDAQVQTDLDPGSSSKQESHGNDAATEQSNICTDDVSVQSTCKRKSDEIAAESTPNKKAAAHQWNQPLWTEAQDALLVEGVEKYKDQGWRRVAEHVGNGRTHLQCLNRWSSYLRQAQTEDFVQQGTPWSEAEEAQLLALVPLHTATPTSHTKQFVHWTAIAHELKRTVYDCKTTWEKHLKKGPFTVEEDALIRQRVAEWGDNGKGIWARLQQEMGRPSNSVKVRWDKLSKR